jgi:hypothetical protein
MARARELGVGLRGRGTRTEPIQAKQLGVLELDEFVAQLKIRSNREIGLMIYDSKEALDLHGPSLPLP